MNHCCVHIDIDLNISTDEWLHHCQKVVDRIGGVPGLEWKLWIATPAASPAASSAGGIYLFRDDASATAYVSGPVVAALRQNPSVRDVRVRTYAVDDALSRRTRAIGAEEVSP